MTGLFNPKPPQLEDPKRMPDAEDPEIVRARRQKVESLIEGSSSRQSRTMSQSTIASAGQPTPYSSTKLGM